MNDSPKHVLGDEALIARQTNTAMSPMVFTRDIALSVLCGIASLMFFGMFSSFLTMESDIGYPTMSIRLPLLLVSVFGLLVWGAIAWFMYLAIHRYLFVRYGQSMRRTFLLLFIIAAPCAFIGIDAITTVMNVIGSGSQYPLISNIFSSFLPLAILASLFFSTLRVVRNNIKIADHLIAKLRKSILIILTIVVFAGITTLTILSDVPGDFNEIFSLLALPITLPLLLLYLLWGAITVSTGFLLSSLGVPGIFGFWITVITAIVLGGILPIAYLVRRKSIPLFLQIAASIIVPLIIVLPMIPRDVPIIDWNVPTIWSWDTLEQSQLNIAYPWAASLMRQDEGMNVGYYATVQDGSIIVGQQRGQMYIVDRFDVSAIKTSPEIKSALKENPYALNNDLPTGFTCDDKTLETLSSDTQGTTGPLGMFGIQCGVLRYNNVEIGTIQHGSLIDLDLSSNDVLAISINMGSYDPTYVYVVDVSSAKNYISQ
ncbi:MAG: hypothetical protein WCT28_04625 [Patescibacteria group bacterium]|jgi:hypothetical protein